MKEFSVEYAAYGLGMARYNGCLLVEATDAETAKVIARKRLTQYAWVDIIRAYQD